MSLVDSHAHLEALKDLEGSLKRTADENVHTIVTIGTSLDSSKKAIDIANKFSTDHLSIYATCGLHPKDAKRDVERLRVNESIHQLRDIAKSSDKVVGIGECGLDYRLTTDPSTSSGQAEQLTTDGEKEYQRELFKAQIELADDLNLPLVIHCRHGWNEIFDVLTSNNQKLIANGVFHSFTGDWVAAQKALDLGFYISFSGIVTFKNAQDIAEVAEKMPMVRMLVETDSPYLSPEPLRGMQNEPKNVRLTARFIANLRKESLDTIEKATSRNAQILFGINN